jgi:hypothetical protein
MIKRIEVNVVYDERGTHDPLDPSTTAAMKIDLDELERKARSATNDPYAMDVWERDNLVHQPQFALALIARIRELEDALRRVINGWERADDIDLSGDRALLEKGAVPK